MHDSTVVGDVIIHVCVASLRALEPRVAVYALRSGFSSSDEQDDSVPSKIGYISSGFLQTGRSITDHENIGTSNLTNAEFDSC